MSRKFTSLLMLFLLVQVVLAQVPTDYYKTADKAKGKELKTAMHYIIKKHVERTYKELWTDMKKTDRRPDGKVWDMYSSVTNYTFGKEQGLNYKKEGDAYNREHSFPKSWFNDAAPMYTDLFHLYPTDGYINGRRSNYPYGETKGERYTSADGWSKLGNCTTPGYTGIVFEPNDEYKGDLARTYFYMATCYEDQIANWETNKGEVFPMLNSTRYPAFSKWALDMLLRWAREDTVSQKEIDRNNEVYKIQKNRNPYIDFPGLEQYVWGDKKDVAFDVDHYVPNAGGGEVDPNPNPAPGEEVAAPVFSMASGIVAEGTEITMSCATTGSYIYYTVNGGDLQVGYAPVKYVVTDDADIVAYAMVGESRSESVAVSYTVSRGPVVTNKVYTKVTSAEELEAGYAYLIVSEGKGMAMGGFMTDNKGQQKTDVRGGAGISVTDGSITTVVGEENTPYEFTLSGDAQGYTFYDAVNKGYLALTSDGNKLYTLANNSTDETKWTISISSKGTEIHSVKYPDRMIQYNASSPRFATYTGSQQLVVLYKETVSSHIDYIEMQRGKVDVYTLDGRLLRHKVAADEALTGLPKGIYVVGGVRLIVK